METADFSEGPPVYAEFVGGYFDGRQELLTRPIERLVLPIPPDIDLGPEIVAYEYIPSRTEKYKFTGTVRGDGTWIFEVVR